MTSFQVMLEILREQILSRQSALFVEVLTILQKQFQKDKKGMEKAFAAGDLNKQQVQQTPRKCFRCGSEDCLISKGPKPPKDNETRQNQVRFSKRNNSASQKGYNNSDNDNDQRIYSSIARMSDNYKITSRDSGDSS